MPNSPKTTRSKRLKRKANAALIAAAPELLAALEFLVQECDSCDGFDVELEGPEHEALEQARAAIAKAKGQ